MRQIVTLGLLLLLSLIPSSIRAQEDDRVPPPGSYGLSFRIPEGGGGGFGIRKLLSARANVGLDVLLDWHSRDSEPAVGPQEDPRTSFRIGLGPNVRLYRRLSSNVLPFVFLGVDGNYTDSPDDAWGWGVGSAVALGAEWFPAASVSLSGVAGMRIGYRYVTDGQGSSVRFVDVAAYRSELMLNIYF